MSRHTMAAKRWVVHWDSCIFFAWLNDEVEAHGPAVMDGIAEMVADIDSGKIIMITSVQTKTDVYLGGHPKPAIDGHLKTGHHA